MKKMFYVLLALLVSMVLVFGVSCDNSNKAPGGAVDLGTDSVKVPAWADGEYDATVSIELQPEVSIEASVGLKISNGVFSVNVFGADMVDSSKITDIRTQTNDEEKKKYTLEAVVSVGGTSGAPTDEKIYSSFVMQLTDSGIDVTIKSEDPTLVYVAGQVINFTEKTSGATE